MSTEKFDIEEKERNESNTKKINENENELLEEKEPEDNIELNYEGDFKDITPKKELKFSKVFIILIVAILSIVFLSIIIVFLTEKGPRNLRVNPLDINTYSNFDKIRQTRIDLNIFADTELRTLSGSATFIFQILKSNQTEIILDNFDVEINNIELLNTHQRLEYFIYDRNKEIEELGTPLIIYLPEKDRNKKVIQYSKGDTLTIKIDFLTTRKSKGMQYLTKEQTKTQHYPFMFTQGEAILTRSLFPCQDTPSAKVLLTVKGKVKQPLVFLFSGVLINNSTENSYNIFEYEQNIPIPTYLIAFACGELEYAEISKRCGVWTEIGLLEEAKKEFDLVDTYLKTAEEYLEINYEWGGKYNILVLPFSFPYGGMENPTLTFVTPSLIAGDKSMANVITHELSHSWFGNLVTNKDWGNFWINEGFTTFMERKILEIINGEDYFKLLAFVGKNELYMDLKNIGENDEFTKLAPNYEHVNPGDLFSTVPYEKGFQFLYYLQSLLGKEHFRNTLKIYIEKYSQESVDYTAYKSVFENYVKENFNNTKEILGEIDWVKWLYTPGKPIIEFDFNNSLVNEAETKAKEYMNGIVDKEKDLEVFKQWDTKVKAIFLNYIFVNIKQVSDSTYKNIRDILKMNGNYNDDVKYIWNQICLMKKDDSCLTYVKDFLLKTGRIKYIRPIYDKWYKMNKFEAKSYFEKHKRIYHPIAQMLINGIFV